MMPITVLSPLILLFHQALALQITSLGTIVEGVASTTSNDADASLLHASCVGSSSSSSSCSSSSEKSNDIDSYGVDHSFPIHRNNDFSNILAKDDRSSPFDSLSKKKFYREFVKGCRDKYSPEGFLCDDNEVERMEMNLRQPASMRNYTTLGFQKVRAPQNVINLLTKFWNDNSQRDLLTNETWNPGNTYTNHWSSPTNMLNIGDATLTGGGESLRTSIWDATRTILEEWTGGGLELSPTSLYGIRIYNRGAVLAPHVDRMPLVISAIINVAQEDMEEDWPLEVYGHDGRAYNLTMEVGDMILYESHSVIHGRPFPLVGKSYANIFVHFEPLGHTLSHEEQNIKDEESLEYLYQQAWEKKQSKCKTHDKECHARVDLNVHAKAPHYILPGSLEEERWIQSHPKSRLSNKNVMVTTFNAHAAASVGDLDSLIAMEELKPESIKKVDENGWTPLHEAARGGHVEVVEYLLGKGLDINRRTHDGKGGSPLWWAKKIHGNNHPVVLYLKAKGAKNIKPE